MNVKYYYEFEGTDKVLNRVEMLCEAAVTSEEIKGGASPFILEYPEVKKLEPVQSSGAKLNLISERVFRFLDLHTDDMQGYLIKFYRAGALYWIGYLDSELYTEDLSATPPYPVEFSAADFNILERLKFQDENEKRYTDITTLLTQIKRCFDRLNLPFLRLYIGCSTTVEDVALSASETALHKLYIQSSNFYDEDGEPMSCREVIESILEPFGLVMVQRDACVYIYDYNTIKAGGVMKCYDFGTLNYQGDVAVPVVLGDLSEIGFASTDATLGFEEMINNTVISCSPYMDTTVLKREIKEENLSVKVIPGSMDYITYTRDEYGRCPGWELLGNRHFIVYTNKDDNKTLIGASLQKSVPGSPGTNLFTVKTTELLISTSRKYYLCLKMQCYVNVRNNPFDANEIAKNKAVVNRLPVNLYTIDEKGNILYYYDNSHIGPNTPEGRWIKSENGTIPSEGCHLIFSQSDLRNADILNSWITNCNYNPYILTDPEGVPEKVPQKEVGTGLFIPIDSTVYGTLVLEFRDRWFVQKLNGNKKYWLYNIDMGDNPTEIKDVLVNNVQMSICDGDQKELKNLDCEFKSYIDKKVVTDFEKKELKVTSCNEEQIPTGKGCILALKNGIYTFQLKYTRGGQTDVLERLLFCSIHSNFTTKNRNISVDIKMTENPAMRYVTYNGILPSKGMLVKGCSLDFDTAVTRITAADFSEDTVKLSSLPYNE